MTELPSLILQLATPSTPSSALQAALDFFIKGSFFMIPLALTSVTALMAIIYKFLSLTSGRVVPRELAEEISRATSTSRTDLVAREIQNGNSTLARLAAVAFKHQGRSETDINHAVETSARQESARLHAGIGILDIVITVAPLLGLLGTASGLVTIFKGLGDTTDHISIARGIAEALNTTIFGLTIAVPSVVAHGYFTRRIELLTARLESILSDLAHVLQKSAQKF